MVRLSRSSDRYTHNSTSGHTCTASVASTTKTSWLAGISTTQTSCSSVCALSITRTRVTLVSCSALNCKRPELATATITTSACDLTSTTCVWRQVSVNVPLIVVRVRWVNRAWPSVRSSVCRARFCLRWTTSIIHRRETRTVFVFIQVQILSQTIWISRISQCNRNSTVIWCTLAFIMRTCPT